MTVPIKGESKTNPRISVVEIGIRDSRELTIYPLSIADEIKMRDILKESLKKAANLSDSAALVGFFIDFAMENIEKILSMVVPKGEKIEEILPEIDNIQAEEIGTIIYKVNFESISKKLKGLTEKWFVKEEEEANLTEKLLEEEIQKTSMRPSENSSEPIHSTT